MIASRPWKRCELSDLKLPRRDNGQSPYVVVPDSNERSLQLSSQIFTASIRNLQLRHCVVECVFPFMLLPVG